MEKIMVDLRDTPITGMLPSLGQVLQRHPQGIQVAVDEQQSLRAVCRLAGKLGYQLRIWQREEGFFIHILK